MSLSYRVNAAILAAGSSRVTWHFTCRQCLRYDLAMQRKSLHSSCSIDQQLQELPKAESSPIPDESGSSIKVSKFADYLAEKKKGEDVQLDSARNVDLAPTDDKSTELSKTALAKKMKAERKAMRLEDRKRRIQDRKRAASLAQKRVLKRKTASKTPSSSSAVNKDDVKTWRQKMSDVLVRQDEEVREEALSASEDSKREDSKSESNGDTQNRSSPPGTKKQRAATLAETISTARSKQPQTSSSEEIRRPVAIPPRQGDQGRRSRLNFDETEILYPPSDVYPPPVPLISDSNPIAAGRALGILKSCDVEWDVKAKPPRWTKSFRLNTYYEEKDLPEYLDNEQALEYLGDSALHLLSRSLIMDRFPGKTVYAYNMASSWLVSNGCFAYMYEDSGLEEERIRVARLLMDISKKREMQAWSSTLTEEQRKQQEETPVGEPVLPTILHLRKADFFEAYVGAVYLTLGFPTVSKWIVPLFEPWVEAIGRTPAFHQTFLLSASGEMEKRAAEQAELKAAEERRRSQTWWGRMRERFFRFG